MQNIKNIDTETLLKDQRVVAEIQRHLWIESEKAGRNIGFEKAKEDWLKKFSKAWMSYNMPDVLLKGQRKADPASQANQPPAQETAAPKKRRAKSYL